MARTLLLCGATGFVGGHLLPVLEGSGWKVVCGSRSPRRARERLGPGPRSREFRRLDVHDAETTRTALQGCDAAVYLVHSMREGGDYEAAEREAATIFCEAAAEAGLKRIVYLGAVVPRGAASKHLRSRLETGRVLREGRVPTVELRAAMIIGADSESWRIVRDLAVRLPFMVLPRWLETRSEPVAVEDIVAAIVVSLDLELDQSTAVSAPGPEILSAREVIVRAAAQLGLRPRSVGVPLLTPWLSSLWIRLVTRANRHLAEELVEGLRSDLIAEGPTIWSHMPAYERMGFDQAARRALASQEATLSGRTKSLERVWRRLRRAPAPDEVLS